MTTFYCIANPVGLVKLTYTPGVIGALDNLRHPIFSKLKVTGDKLQTAFDGSEQLILCKSLNDAKALRMAKIVIGNTAPEFVKGAIAQGYPLADHGIYEVDVEQDIGEKFVKLKHKNNHELQGLVSENLYFTAAYIENGREQLPDIEVYVANKSDLTFDLVASHYFSLENGRDEINNPDQGCSIS